MNCGVCNHREVCRWFPNPEEYCSDYESERPHGEWKKYGDKVEVCDISGIKTWGQTRRCTICGFIKTYIEDFGLYSFCPNCGTPMTEKALEILRKREGGAE